jgi:hypothetical protein
MTIGWYDFLWQMCQKVGWHEGLWPDMPEQQVGTWLFMVHYDGMADW